MIVQCFLLTFLVFLLPVCCSGTGQNSTSGTFKTSILSAKDCINPARPYLKNPPIIFHPSIQNIDGKSMLNGNLTIVRDTKDVTIKVKGFSWRNGKWYQFNSFNNLNCHGAVLHFTLLAIRIKYDKKNCMFLKGVYSFHVYINQLQHIWIGSMPYGRVMWRSETYSSGGMFICKEFDTITEPA